jgi:hypothetical protein
MSAATRYSYIEEKGALGILGYFGERQLPNGVKVRGHLMPRKSLPTRLCSGKEFHEKIASNLTVNKIGIPQGLPISDVLANAVLLQFDLQVQKRCKMLGGRYYRYSDDLFFVLPGKSVDHHAWIQEIEQVLSSSTQGLELGHNKTVAYVIERLSVGEQRIAPISCYKQLSTVDYLGLSYDGISVYLRQSTLSRLERRIVNRVRRHVRARLHEDPKATQQQILSRLHLEGIMREFGRIEDSHRVTNTSSNQKSKRSFRCYAVRASKAAGFKVSRILQQISHLNNFIRARAKHEVRRQRP